MKFYIQVLGALPPALEVRGAAAPLPLCPTPMWVAVAIYLGHGLKTSRRELILLLGLKLVKQLIISIVLGRSSQFSLNAKADSFCKSC